MEATDTRPGEASGEAHGASPGWAAAAILWGTTLAIFWPALRWLVAVTLDQQQLVQAFVVFGVAGLLLASEGGGLRPVWRLGPAVTWRLLVAYALVALAMWLKWPVLVLVALCAAIGAAARFVFGERARHASRWVVPALGLYLFLVVAMPFFDWPLRILSGRFGAWLLDAAGRQVQLFVVLRPDPSLMLVMDGRVFEVAAECNGFGLLGSTSLLALLLAGASREAWWRRVGKGCVSVALGFAANVLRIFVICLCSGWAGQRHYHLMHEVVGTACVIAALGAVWWLWRGSGRDHGERSQPTR